LHKTNLAVGINNQFISLIFGNESHYGLPSILYDEPKTCDIDVIAAANSASCFVFPNRDRALLAKKCTATKLPETLSIATSNSASKERIWPVF
jgi:hypothetical protein